MLRNFLWIGLGGGIGSMLRFGISLVYKNDSFPFSTMIINIIGSFCIGMVFAASVKNEQFPEHLKLFLATGLCGCFTTFSAFSLENMQLMRSGNYGTAALYIIVSVIACLLATFAGFKILNG